MEVFTQLFGELGFSYIDVPALSVVACLFLILAGFNPVTDLIARWASPAVVDTVAAFSVVTHFDGFQKGVVDSRDLLFFLSLIGFSLFATGVILRNR